MFGIKTVATLACVGLLAAPIAVEAAGEGDKAPGFSAKTMDGSQTLAINQYRGKVVYLDFWASWCGPCLKSLPLLEGLRKDLEGKDFQILAINVDKDLSKAMRFLEQHPVGYPSLKDPDGRLPGTFAIETMPTSFLIDREGVIRYVHKGFKPSDMPEIRERIESLLKE